MAKGRGGWRGGWRATTTGVGADTAHLATHWGGRPGGWRHISDARARVSVRSARGQHGQHGQHGVGARPARPGGWWCVAAAAGIKRHASTKSNKMNEQQGRITTAGSIHLDVRLCWWAGGIGLGATAVQPVPARPRLGRPRTHPGPRPQALQSCSRRTCLPASPAPRSTAARRTHIWERGRTKRGRRAGNLTDPPLQLLAATPAEPHCRALCLVVGGGPAGGPAGRRAGVAARAATGTRVSRTKVTMCWVVVTFGPSPRLGENVRRVTTVPVCSRLLASGCGAPVPSSGAPTAATGPPTMPLPLGTPSRGAPKIVADGAKAAGLCARGAVNMPAAAVAHAGVWCWSIVLGVRTSRETTLV